jgi:Glycosyltransferase family 87
MINFFLALAIDLIFVALFVSIVNQNANAPQKKQRNWKLLLGYELPLFIMSLFLLIVSIPPSLFSDFIGCYFVAGKLVFSDPSQLYNFGGAYGFVNIPIFSTIFIPLSVLSKKYAIILFGLLGLITIILSYFKIIKIVNVFSFSNARLIGILFLANGPMYHSLWYGNFSHFLLGLVLIIYILLENKRDFWVGAASAALVIVKPLFILLLIYFLLRKKWLALGGFGISLLAIIGTSIVMFGWDLHLAWLHHLSYFSGKVVIAYNNQSLDAVLGRLLLIKSDYASNAWEPMVLSGGFKVVRYILMSLLVGGVILVSWLSKAPKIIEEENLEFSIFLCLALLIAPISWTHYFLLLIVPFSLYLSNKLAIPQGRMWSSIIWLSITLTSLPVATWVVLRFPTQGSPISLFYSKFWISHYFLGAILFLGVMLAARWHATKNRHGSKMAFLDNTGITS